MGRDNEIEKGPRHRSSGKARGERGAKAGNLVRILILEDDLHVLAALMEKIGELEKGWGEANIALTVLSESTQVEEYINRTRPAFDVILLDRDCKACGSFHVLDIEKFGPEKIIAISGVPEWNEEARRRGVKKIILKDLDNLDGFAGQAVEEIKKVII